MDQEIAELLVELFGVPDSEVHSISTDENGKPITKVIDINRKKLDEMVDHLILCGMVYGRSKPVVYDCPIERSAMSLFIQNTACLIRDIIDYLKNPFGYK